MDEEPNINSLRTSRSRRLSLNELGKKLAFPESSISVAINGSRHRYPNPSALPNSCSDKLELRFQSAHTETVPTPALSPAAALAFKKTLDRCGELLEKKRASDAEPWREELDGLTALIAEHYKDEPAEHPIRGIGLTYYIDLTKRENRRKVVNKQRAFEKLKKAMGIGILIEALSYPFALLDKHVSMVDQATFVTQKRTGSRDISAVLIATKTA